MLPEFWTAHTGYDNSGITRRSPIKEISDSICPPKVTFKYQSYRNTILKMPSLNVYCAQETS